MELALQKFIRSIDNIVDTKNLDFNNVFVLQMPVKGKDYTLVASIIEPTNFDIPINGVWLNFNSISKYYSKALRLVGLRGLVDSSITIDPAYIITDGGFINTWVQIDTYSSIFKYLNIKNTLGPDGPRGRQGPPGIAGPTPVIDYPPIIAEAIRRFNVARGA